MLSELQKLVQVEGPGLRNGRGPNGLQAAGIPDSFIPQMLTECLLHSKHRASAVDRALCEALSLLFQAYILMGEMSNKRDK